MHRFYIGAILPQESELHLPEPEAQHAVKVLRIRAGEQVTLLNGAGVEYICEVLETGRRDVRVQVLHEKAHPPLPCRIVLMQGVPKGKAMDLIVQKAAELGVSEVVPVLTERTVTHITPSEAPAKADRWRATAIEALKQCGCPWLPKIHPPATFSAVKPAPAELNFVGALTSEAGHPRKIVDQFRNRQERAPRSVAVWIGPEGDFTGKEMSALLSAGVHPITLGRWVLRSETAAIYSLSILNHELTSPS